MNKIDTCPATQECFHFPISPLRETCVHHRGQLLFDCACRPRFSLNIVFFMGVRFVVFLDMMSQVREGEFFYIIQ